MRARGRRVLRIEERECVRDPELGPSHLIVYPDEWPEEDCLAYDTLYDSGEFDAWAELLEKHAGRRPGPRTRVIAFRLRADRPQ